MNYAEREHAKILRDEVTEEHGRPEREMFRENIVVVFLNSMYFFLMSILEKLGMKLA